jgi:hypothetical protein
MSATVRDHCGRYASPAPRTAPLLAKRVLSAPHVRGAATRWARWCVVRDAMTRLLKEFINERTTA